MASFIFKAINSSIGPKPVGPYSSAVQINNILYLSGVVGINDEHKLVNGGISAQTKQAFKNIQTILEEAGTSLNKVATVKVYVEDISDGPIINEIYKDYLKPPYPARSMFQVAKLPMGAKIEIEVTAFIGEQSRL